MKQRFVLLLTGLFFLFCFPSGAAASYIVSSVTATVEGGDMEGLRVTVFFDDNSSSTIDWLPDSPISTSGAAEDNIFSLSNTGNTYYTPWLLELYGEDAGTGDPITKNILAMTLEGLYNFPSPGIVFDVIASPKLTPGSAYGGYDMDLPYSSEEEGLSSGVVGNLSYSEEVYLQGTTPPTPQDQDLYAKATITFSGNGLAPGGTFFFLLDTDKVEAVPIPGAYLLLGSGLLCLIGIKRRAQ